MVGEIVSARMRMAVASGANTDEEDTTAAAKIDELLQVSAALHDHLCPRQVLGVRMGLLAADLLGLPLPQSDKRLLTIAETDGCFADGISTATGCWVGHRTLRIVDYGKVAATFVDSQTERAFRVAPSPDSRERTPLYADGAHGHWQTYLFGYQRMPVDQLFVWREVSLVDDVRTIVSHPKARAICARCREEIINEREVIRDGQVLCRACALPPYYTTVACGRATPTGTLAGVMLTWEFPSPRCLTAELGKPHE